MLDWATIIAFSSIGIGLVAYAVNHYLIKKREIETREYRIRRKQYQRLVEIIVKCMHKVKTKKEKTTFDDKLEMDYAANLLYLYASGDVLRVLKAYIDDGKTENFQRLISAMRNDLNIRRGDFGTAEVIFFNAQ